MVKRKKKATSYAATDKAKLLSEQNSERASGDAKDQAHKLTYTFIHSLNRS